MNPESCSKTFAAVCSSQPKGDLMNDVLPPCRGYLPVYIRPNGYIENIEDGELVHLESRDMQEWYGCFDSFTHAKSYVMEIVPDNKDIPAILELTGEGGGAAIWALPEHINDVTTRRDRWSGCYGTWPVRAITI